MFGIDQQVQQTADAYRGKPQMLQQKYAQNQQLIDLLALQKLKSDKEEAARKLALDSGAQGKSTILDQRESEALDTAKKEVMDEQAGIMQNKMQQMQDAQKKVLQAAGAPQMPSAPQPTPAPGLAGLAAPNIQGMAGGGIVAFDQGGSTGEEEARRAMVERPREEPRQVAPQAAPQGNMQTGLARLLGIDPEAIYQSRRSEAARDANLSAQEAASKRALNAEREAFEMRNKLGEALTAGSGYVSGAAGLANIGRTAVNIDRNAMQRRHALENEIIDMGPASRMAGTKAGEAGYQHGMTGLTSGVKAGVDLAQTGEQGALRAQMAKDALAGRADKLRADVLLRVEGLVTNDPQYKNIVKATEMAENVANMAPTTQNIARRDTLRRDQSTFYNQMFRDKLQHHLSDAGNAGTPPPIAGPAPIDWNSLPPRRP